MESGDLKTIQRDVEALKKTVNKLKANLSELEVIKAFILCHKPGPDPEGQLTSWAKKELDEARRIPDSENVSLEEVKKRILRR